MKAQIRYKWGETPDMTYTTLEFDNWPIERVEVDRDSRLMSLTFSTKEAQYTFLEAMVKFARERGLLD